MDHCETYLFVFTTHRRAALARLLDFIEGDDGSMLPFDRQHVQSAMEVLTGGLLRWVDDLSPQLLVSITCLLAKLRYFDRPLLNRLMEASVGKRLAGFKPWQASGLLWALGRWVLLVSSFFSSGHFTPWSLHV